MTSYGQFCPLAKAMEFLDERWTLLVVRELLAGSTHFNDLRRGNPRMSPALLAKRLRSLERAGIVRRAVDGAGRSSYELTPSGRELRPIVEGLAEWGIRWVGALGQEDLDPHLLLWDIRRTIDPLGWPEGRTVLALRFDDVAAGADRWWICVAGPAVEVCDYDPGFEVLAVVDTSLRALTEIWRGDRDWGRALGAGLIRVDGPRAVARALPRWFGQMRWAEVPRPPAAA